jgi:hypothetical protein
MVELRKAISDVNAEAEQEKVTGAQPPVPADTAASVTPSSTQDTTIVDTGDLTLPYNAREKKTRARQLAKALGMGSARTATFEAGIPTTVDGVEVPTYLYTDDEITNINGARQMRADMNNTTAELIPTRQSGQGLQNAQAEANRNAGEDAGASAIVQQNIAPNTVNNAATTNIATRNQHHKVQNHELLVGAY